jgi:hypothetical protein
MNGQQSLNRPVKRGARPGTEVWVWFLIAGAALATTRVALLVWLNRRLASHTSTGTDYLLLWLYPEAVISRSWNSLSALGGTKYYVAWCLLITLGSFVMATPILLGGWRRQRRLRRA